MRHTYRKASLDELLWALGGFAEGEPKPIDRRRERFVKLWAEGCVTTEIMQRLGMSRQLVSVERHNLGLPKRQPATLGAGRPRRSANIHPPVSG